MSATLYATSDLFGDLKPRHCHAVMHGRILRGQLVVWRCPSQLPWDFELWEAVPIPSSRPVPSNYIVVSRAGLAMTRLAGGETCAAFPRTRTSSHFWLLSVQGLHVLGFEALIDARLAKWQLRFDGAGHQRLPEFTSYCLTEVVTCNLRGQVCALAERMRFRHVQNPSCEETRRLALLWIVGCPEQYAAEVLMNLLRKMRAKARLHTKEPRSTRSMQQCLRVTVSDLSYQHRLNA